jgi:cytoskeleton protein RodZ
MIRDARQKKGIHMAVLSVTLKVPIRQLEALELDQHSAFKGSVFVRALASSVCRQLQMDPAPVLALLPQSLDRLPIQRQSIEPSPADARTQFDAFAVIRSIPLQPVAIALVMVALIAALLWAPSPSTWAWLQPPHKVDEPVLQVPVVLEPQAPDASAEKSQDIQSQPAAVDSQPPTAAPSPVALPMASAPASVPGAAVLAFTASNDSWIEIRDGKNQVLWTRLIRAGESEQVQYPLPMNVVVGRAHVVSVTYKGKPFDLVPYTKATVARFEVKE